VITAFNFVPLFYTETSRKLRNKILIVDESVTTNSEQTSSSSLFWSLNAELKHDLFLASSNALKLSLHYSCSNLSHNELNKLTNRATPEMFLNYELSLLLFKTFNNIYHHQEWIQLNFNMILTSRQKKFKKWKTVKAELDSKFCQPVSIAWIIKYQLTGSIRALIPTKFAARKNS
jgi:hypothetical protein